MEQFDSWALSCRRRWNRLERTPRMRSGKDHSDMSVRCKQQPLALFFAHGFCIRSPLVEMDKIVFWVSQYEIRSLCISGALWFQNFYMGW
ncbi:uncharacterized protein LOC143885534 isoform X2 [Tasmannia lanceolata]|uniref:uncharacterized protein LOC143885534 isoform X2 n=1 Tax=Tasmannia lanceolata TaxID=3420 RepID=UPI004063BEF7